MAANKTLTIFTPTYNRAYILPKLYESLCRQSCDDFVWSIVDDGSTDNTEELVRGWIDDNKIEIKYLRQENGGKMRAHNRGVERCGTPLFVCVDSDDYMTDTAVEEILDFWHNNYHGEENICGMIANRAMIYAENGIPTESVTLPPIKSCCFRDLGTKYSHRGETSVVYLTDLIKKYPFPEIPGEKFITEAFVYDQIDYSGYQYILNGKPVVICEYRSDGYTMNSLMLFHSAPTGWAMFYNQKVKFWRKATSYKNHLRSIVYYIIMCRIKGNTTKEIYRDCADRSVNFFVALALSPYYKCKLFKKINNA